MSADAASLAKRVFSNTGFGLLDQVLFKIGTAVAFILLVRLLPPSGMIAVGVGMGYLVFIAYLNFGLTRILLRDYPNIKQSRYELDLHFTAYLVFWCLQTGLMVLLCLGLIFFALSGLDVPGLPFLFLGMTIDFIALGFQDLVKGIFYVDLRQRLATKIGIILSLLRLGSYGVLFFWPSLEIYTWLLIGSAGVNCVVWGVALRSNFQFRPTFAPRILHIIKHSLNDYVLWDHLNRTSFNTLHAVDTVILSLFGLLHDVGNYVVALKVTSLLFLVPSQLSRGLQVTLANCADDRGRTEAINSFLKVNGAISLAQLAFIIFGGSWLLHLLFGQDIAPDVVRFTIVLAVAVTVMNLGWPLVGIINNLCSLRLAFFLVYLPALILGGSIYIGATWLWGAIGIAYGNVAVYLILLIGLGAFVKRHYPLRLKMQLITVEERKFLRELTEGFSWSTASSTNPPG